MGLKDFLHRKFAKDEEFKEMERQLTMQKKLEAKQKNSNERELDRFEEEARQKRINERLEQFRKEKKDEFFHGPNLMKQKNIFKGHTSVLTNNKKLLQLNNKIKAHGMFFK